MTRKEYNAYQLAAQKGTMPDNENPAFIFSMVSSDLLSKIAKGEIDAKAVALRTLEDRGQNIDGQWVGFDNTLDELYPLVVIKQGLESNLCELLSSDVQRIKVIIELIEEGMGVSAKKLARKSSETVRFYTLVQ